MKVGISRDPMAPWQCLGVEGHGLCGLVLSCVFIVPPASPHVILRSVSML